MNKRTKKKSSDAMLPEYDFASGTPGKHTRQYERGHTVTIYKKDGTTIIQNFKLEEDRGSGN